MKTQHITQADEIELITTRAKTFAEFCGCNAVQCHAAAQAAKNLFLYGQSSKGNAICAGVRIARRWKRQGIGVIKDNIIDYQSRVAQMRQAGQAIN